MKNLVLLLTMTAIFTSCGFEIVDDGHVGIKKTMGKVETDEYAPGLHFYNPFTTGISEMSVREQAWEGKAAAYSLDNQIVEILFQVNYKPVSTQMAELYIGQGEDYVNVILPQRTSAAIKGIIGKYKATNLVSARGKVTSEIKAELQRKLEGTNVTLVDFELTNFDYDDDFERAVKAKIVAVERAIEEKNRTVQIKEQATQKVELAKADAEAIKIRAAALKENKSLIELEAVKKWDGVMPVYMMGGQATPFINLDRKE